MAGLGRAQRQAFRQRGARLDDGQEDICAHDSPDLSAPDECMYQWSACRPCEAAANGQQAAGNMQWCAAG